MKRKHERKNAPISNSQNIIEKALFPANSGVRNKKPKVLILFSPFDVENGTLDRAVKYTHVKKLLAERGFDVVNKKPIISGDRRIFCNPNEKHNSLNLNSQKEKNITIWLEAHGNISWLFSSDDNASNEVRDIAKFTSFLDELEEVFKVKIDCVILSACYSATELMLEGKKSGCIDYINSSARLLSAVMNGRKVVGFISLNNSAKVTGLYKLDSNMAKKPNKEQVKNIIYDNDISILNKASSVTVPLYEGAVAYKNGKVIQSPRNQYYIDTSYMLDKCSYDTCFKYFSEENHPMENGYKENIDPITKECYRSSSNGLGKLYRVCNGVEEIGNTQQYIQTFGEKQMNCVVNHTKKHRGEQKEWRYKSNLIQRSFNNITISTNVSSYSQNNDLKKLCSVNSFFRENVRKNMLINDQPISTHNTASSSVLSGI